MQKFLRNVLVIIGLCLVTTMTGCLPNLNFSVGRPDNTIYSDSSKVSNQVVRTAATQIGRKYKLGGESPRTGFDCSGLVYWSYKQHGIKVPRVTASQARIGQKINRQNLRVGDIVVFRTSNSPNGLHTGLYAGKNSFIHSPNSKSRVKIDSLTRGTYWGDHLLYGRRVVSTRYAQNK